VEFDASHGHAPPRPGWVVLQKIYIKFEVKVKKKKIGKKKKKKKNLEKK